MAGADGAAWAALSKELSAKPLSHWILLTRQGTPVYWHPPLMFWLMGLSLKLFGGGTLAALLPALVLSTLTLIVLFRIGELLWDHPFGMSCSLALILTPQFIRTARIPMLEPGLMFFIYLALLFHLLFLRSKSFRWSLLFGIGLALAFSPRGYRLLSFLGSSSPTISPREYSAGVARAP